MNDITLKLSAIALGAALFSTAGAAGLAPGQVDTHHVATLRATSSYSAPASSMSVQSWDVADANGKVFLALCVEPGTPLAFKTADYKATGAFTFAAGKDDAVVRQAAIARLYSHYYGDITGTSLDARQDSLSFQLALWELNNDNGNLKDGTLAFKWNATTSSWSQNKPEFQGILNTAAEMISWSSVATNPVEQAYSFTQYTMTGSQTIVVATPVPEPSTWAMLGLGLALVGFTARRRSKR